MNVREIRLEQIEPNPYQYRTAFPETEMAELAASIEAQGVLQPILIRSVAGKHHEGIHYQIVAGERRFRAAKAAHLKTIPAVVKSANDMEALTLAIIENSQRDDPDDWATANGIRQLMDMSAASGNPLSERDVAQKFNKSVGYVRNHLQLLKLRPALQEVAQKHSSVKSSLFEIQKVKDVATERDLLEAVETGAAYTQIKQSVEEHLNHEKLLRDSQRPPDAHTASHIAQVARTGGISTSRGKIARGNAAGEAFENSVRALKEIEYKLETLRHWKPLLTPAQLAKLAPAYEGLAMQIEAEL